MAANVVSVSRVVLTFWVISVLGRHPGLDVLLIGTIALIICLDGVDGYIARKRAETSEVGGVLDTLADRLIENTFFLYFSVQGLIPVWMPIVVMCRGFLTDAVQRLQGYPRDGWRHVLTRSRVSRAVSGVSKLLAFTSLGSALVFQSDWLEDVSRVLTGFAVGVCLLRGIPFVFGRPKSRNV